MHRGHLIFAVLVIGGCSGSSSDNGAGGSGGSAGQGSETGGGGESAGTGGSIENDAANLGGAPGVGGGSSTGGSRATGGAPGTGGAPSNSGGASGSIAGQGGNAGALMPEGGRDASAGSGGAVVHEAGSVGTGGTSSPIDSSIQGQGGSMQADSSADVSATIDAQNDIDSILGTEAPAPEAPAPFSDAGGSDAPTCLPAGSVCTTTPGQCCLDSVCVGDITFALCSARCLLNTDCLSGCCAPLQNGGSVCSPPSFCPPPLCADLQLKAPDGAYLGNATSNPFGLNGVCNVNSLYGSSFGIFSIHNPSGPYGSTTGIDSAYNAFTISPPFLLCATTGQTLNQISKNQFAGLNVIDPDQLCTALAAAGY